VIGVIPSRAKRGGCGKCPWTKRCLSNNACSYTSLCHAVDWSYALLWNHKYIIVFLLEKIWRLLSVKHRNSNIFTVSLEGKLTSSKFVLKITIILKMKSSKWHDADVAFKSSARPVTGICGKLLLVRLCCGYHNRHGSQVLWVIQLTFTTLDLDRLSFWQSKWFVL